MFARGVAVTLCALAVFTVGSAMSLGRDGISSYNISVTLSPQDDTLVGAEWVDYVNDTEKPAGEVVFVLVANWGRERNPYVDPALLDEGYVAGFDPTWTVIDDVSDASKAPLPYRFESSPPSLQTYSLDDVFLVVDLPKPLLPGERVTMHIGFRTKFAEALGADMCVYRDTYIWRFGWNPIAVARPENEDVFALPAALYHAEVSVPPEYRTFGGADEQTSSAAATGWTTTTLSSDRPVRSVPLVIGRGLFIASTTWNGVPIDAVCLSGAEDFARVVASEATEILSAYSARFGTLASRRLVIVEDPTPGLYGLASDGMVLLGSHLSRMKDMPAIGMYDRLIEYALAHELAHLWWGIGVGADFNAENWISEGFAEYLSVRYFEDRYGVYEPNLFAGLGEGLVEDLISDVFGYYNLRQHMMETPYLALLKMGFDEGIVKPLRDVSYLNGESIRTYKKGYLVLRAVESVLGRDRMDEVLRDTAAAWAGRTLTVAALREIVERAAGNALYPGFFDDWVVGDAQLDIAVDGFESSLGEDGYTTTAIVRRSGPPLPVTIAATLADGSTVRTTWISSDGTTAAVPFFVTALPVVHIHVDPEEMLPDRDRFNNHWPRRVLVDSPLRAMDAPPVGRPLDAYVIKVESLAVSGSFRDDHEWSIMAFPHVDEDTDLSSLDWAELFSHWDVLGAFAADIDRRLSLRGSFTVLDFDFAEVVGDVDASFTAIVSFYTHPDTGSPGRYWYPTYGLDMTFGILGTVSSLTPYASFTLSRSALPARDREGSIALVLGIPGLGEAPFASLEWDGAIRYRWAALLYLDLSASICEALIRPLPSSFQFSLDRLHGFSELPAGQRQVFVGVDVVLPPFYRDWGYAVLNLARVDSVTPVFFLRGGRTWLEAPPVFDLGFRLETGGEFRFALVGPLGLGVDLAVGYAYPLIGWDSADQIYLSIGFDL